MAKSGVSGQRIYHAPPRKLAVAHFRPSQREDKVNVLDLRRYLCPIPENSLTLFACGNLRCARCFISAALIRLDFSLNVAPPSADATSGGSHSDDDGDQYHCQQNSVLYGRCCVFRQNEAASCFQDTHPMDPRKLK